MDRSSDIRGFTLVELMVSLVVTGVILSAVAALAFAMNTSADVGADRALSQAQYRQTVLWLCDLIGKAPLVCAKSGADLVVWASDDDNDNAIDVNEVVYIGRNDESALALRRFETDGNHEVSLESLKSPATKSSLRSNYTEVETKLISTCESVDFTCDSDPPQTQRVTISLDLTEDDGVHRYEIDVALRAWAGYLLNTDGTALVSDDD